MHTLGHSSRFLSVGGFDSQNPQLKWSYGSVDTSGRLYFHVWEWWKLDLCHVLGSYMN